MWLFYPTVSSYIHGLNEVYRASVVVAVYNRWKGAKGHMWGRGLCWLAQWQSLDRELCDSMCHGNNQPGILTALSCDLILPGYLGGWGTNHPQPKMKSQIETSTHSVSPLTLSKFPEAGITPKAVTSNYFNSKTSYYLFSFENVERNPIIT